MGEGEVREESEAEKNINAWRQSERKIMIETVQDLIQTSHKYAKSQYTPSAQRARWTKLAGQLIWYKDQIMKNFTLEAMTIELQALKKHVVESEQQRAREGATRNYPLIGLRKQPDGKTQNKETSEKVEEKAPQAAD